MNPPVYVMTNKKYYWTLKPFIYLFDIFWSKLQHVVIVGYEKPDFELPANYDFLSVSPENQSANLWSNALIFALQHCPDDYVILMLDDYWLIRTVDHNGIASLTDYMSMRKDILRMDLTNDRMHARGDARDALDFVSWGHYDVIMTPPATPYQFSLQTAIWNRRLLLDILHEGKTPWELELQTNVPNNLLVLGTRQWPCRYVNAVLKGKIETNQVDQIPQPHLNVVRGLIPANWTVEVPA